MMRDNERRSAAGFPPRLTRDRAKGLTVQMIEMRMRHHYQVNRWQIAQLYTRLPQPLQDKQPAGKVRVNHYILSAHLDEEAGMANKGHSQLSVDDQSGFIGLSGAWSHRGMLHQPPERPGTFAKHRILETGF